MLLDKDKKESFDNFERLEYPTEVTNYDRNKATVGSLDEHLQHAQSAKKGTTLLKLVVSRIHPKWVITDESWSYMEMYMRFKRYGMQFLFPEGIDSIPNKTLHALDQIDIAIQKDEEKKYNKASAKANKAD